MAVVMVQTGLCQRRGLLVAFARKAPTCVGCRFLASRAFVHSGPVTTACGMADLHCPLVVASPWEIEVLSVQRSLLCLPCYAQRRQQRPLLLAPRSRQARWASAHRPADLLHGRLGED